MRNFARLFLLAALGIFILSGADCNKHPSGPEIPLFSYLDPIVNPPDTFQIAYNVSTYGDKIAHVTFSSDGVWFIEKLGDGRVTFKAVNTDTDSTYIVNRNDSLGLKAGVHYVFIANNNNYTDIGNYFVQFTKLPLDYNNFEPKLK